MGKTAILFPPQVTEAELEDASKIITEKLAMLKAKRVEKERLAKIEKEQKDRIPEVGEVWKYGGYVFAVLGRSDLDADWGYLARAGKGQGLKGWAFTRTLTPTFSSLDSCPTTDPRYGWSICGRDPRLKSGNNHDIIVRMLNLL